ncbi:unnamed protein product [Prorocentrum cordatum]|uniref:WWE domain-containing protein n=1 Tax=Prorocentrum cordatum TaxID=2364126 RepID=A0ABN9W6B4_9DINO|nr:unnamed protein product [Polarella glacialis]
MADRDLAGYDAELARRARVIPGLDARLVRIDARAGTDSFHVLQGLKDPEAEREVSKCCYLYQRFGSTGTRGAIEVEGPMEQPKVARLFAEIFKTKTGSEFGSVQPGDRANPGMHWLQQQATPDLKAQWQYYVSDGVDGKRTGWYPYEGSASDEVEELYSQHVANARESRTATRVVSSGYFTYHVDLDNMKQTNQRTKKVRSIRRAHGEEPREGGATSAGREVMKAMKAKARAMTPMAAMKRSAKAEVKAKRRLSKVGTKAQVLAGKREKTKWGLRKEHLVKSKKGKTVTKRKSAAGKKTFDQNLAKWILSFRRARAELGLTGFVLVKKGAALYSKTREYYNIAVGS